MLNISKYIPKLSQLYCEPHRHYHNLEHIHSLTRNISKLYDMVDFSVVSKDTSEFNRGHLKLTDHLMFVAWFHDAYYDPYAGSPFNESISASILYSMVSDDIRGSDDIQFVESVAETILLTAKHSQDLSNEEHAIKHFMFLDLDMLGFSDIDAMTRNNIQIRKEYYATSDIDYYHGRIKFLQSLLDKPRIYYILKPEYEERARHNISQCIASDNNFINQLTD